MVIIVKFFNNGLGMKETITSTNKEVMLDINPSEELRKAFNDGFKCYYRDYLGNGDVALYLN